MGLRGLLAFQTRRHTQNVRMHTEILEEIFDRPNTNTNDFRRNDQGFEKQTKIQIQI
jgi:hypothetical protein